MNTFKMLVAFIFSIFRPQAVMVKFRDAAFQYRMGAGSPGDVNRTHPVSIEPCKVDATNPPLFYGSAIVLDGTSHDARKVIAGDTALTDVYGFAVRAYPVQQASATNYGAVDFGDAVPPTNQPLDVMRSGYIMTKLGGATASVKGGTVYVWIAASAGAHVQGAVEAAATMGSTIALPATTTFNGPADPSGVVEIAVRP